MKAEILSVSAPLPNGRIRALFVANCVSRTNWLTSVRAQFPAASEVYALSGEPSLDLLQGVPKGTARVWQGEYRFEPCQAVAG